MAKQAISVTLDADNIAWLKGRVTTAGARSISDLLDQIVSAARRTGGTPRSVVGTIEIAASDPHLDEADEAVRSIFQLSLQRPALARERRTSYTSGVKRRRG